jgi:hypothetical protein
MCDTLRIQLLFYLRVSGVGVETPCRSKSLDKHGAPGNETALMNDLNPIIPGFYADEEGRIYLNMGEFLAAYDMPDTPELRAVVWDEVRDIFQMEVIEIVD